MFSKSCTMHVPIFSCHFQDMFHSFSYHVLSCSDDVRFQHVPNMFQTCSACSKHVPFSRFSGSMFLEQEHVWTCLEQWNMTGAWLEHDCSTYRNMTGTWGASRRCWTWLIFFTTWQSAQAEYIAGMLLHKPFPAPSWCEQMCLVSLGDGPERPSRKAAWMKVWIAFSSCSRWIEGYHAQSPLILGSHLASMRCSCISAEEWSPLSPARQTRTSWPCTLMILSANT